jgi:DNA-directed RNA polymerase subunit RPC12/RpoP
VSDASDTEEFIIPAQGVAPSHALVVPAEDIVLDQVVAATPPAVDAPAPGAAIVIVCPRCGADRLAREPWPIVHIALRLVSPNRRYRCANCHRVVWRHRLLRQTSAADDDVFDPHTPLTKELLFFTVVTVGFVVYLGVMMKECADEAPPPPSDVSQLVPQ